MEYQNYTLTAGQSFEYIQFCRWLRSIDRQLTMENAISIGKNMISGHSFIIELSINQYLTGKEFCNIVPAIDEDSTELEQRKQKEYSNLLIAGAAGNKEAAITYCKLVVQGLVSNGAYA